MCVKMISLRTHIDSIRTQVHITHMGAHSTRDYPCKHKHNYVTRQSEGSIKSPYTLLKVRASPQVDTMNYVATVPNGIHSFLLRRCHDYPPHTHTHTHAHTNLARMYANTTPPPNHRPVYTQTHTYILIVTDRYCRPMYSPSRRD